MMASYADQFLWVIYPYLSLTILIVGIAYRYTRDRLSITSKSSELLEKKTLRYGNLMFHWGLIFVILGHFAGLFIPLSVFQDLGVSNSMYHTAAGLLGGVFGSVAWIGLIVLTVRRLGNDRIRMNSSLLDIFALFLLLVIISLGLSLTLGYDHFYGTYEYRLTISPWIRGILTFHPDASLMSGVPLIFKIHILVSFLLYPVIPFTRLVHLFSAPVKYLFRRPQIFRKADMGYVLRSERKEWIKWEK